MSWRGKPVIVTGGMGFIGSNLVRRLAEAGAEVTVIDRMLAQYGANPFNLSGLALPELIEDGVEDRDLSRAIHQRRLGRRVEIILAARIDGRHRFNQAQHLAGADIQPRLAEISPEHEQIGQQPPTRDIFRAGAGSNVLLHCAPGSPGRRRYRRARDRHLPGT